MRIFKLLLIFSTVIFSLFIFYFSSAKADDDLTKQLQEKQQEISDLQRQLDEAHGQEKTLRSQLTFIDTQTKLTILKIEETKFQIAKLTQEISDLSSRINRIATNVDTLSNLLLGRIVQTYKYGNVTAIDLLFSSHGFGDLIERLKYIEVAQANDKKVLYQLQATKAAYHDQKQDKEQRETQQKALQDQLEKYQKDLEEQKKAKDELLRITQNNEAVYQAKLQAALAEQQAILGLVNNIINEVSEGSIHKGDTIGHYITFEFRSDGSSACSSGAHLHFEVRQNSVPVNPANLLSNKSVGWDNSPDSPFGFSGSWNTWPLHDSIKITQGFGNTWWAQHGWYGGGIHTGVDMASSDTSVIAVHDGTLYHGGIGCGGGTLHYKRVDHGDGTSSYYLHIL